MTALPSPIQQKPATKHEQITCFACSGHGVVSDYGALGADFEGPKECSSCGGSGQIIRYGSGVLASYVGGPLLGRDVRK